MGKLICSAFTVSIDGFGAGPDQDLNNPMGVGTENLHQWFRGTDTFAKMQGKSGEKTGVDEKYAARSMRDMGAWILGRNMFGPVRGPWPNLDWKGWWGDSPPYHVPVYVLTHHARPPLEMKGGTTFYFVTDGIESALRQAKEAAKGKDIRVGGGVSTIRQYLQAGLMDEMHLAISPVVLGRGEQLLQGIDLKKLGFSCTQHETSANAMHVVLEKK